jgi:hypothetical protein
MPISGLVIRLVCTDLAQRAEALETLSGITGLELGLNHAAGVAAVLDAPDYVGHDAALARIGEAPFVCAIDVVSHDFSDVEHFEGLPRTKRELKR